MKLLVLISTMTLALMAHAQQYSWQVIARPTTQGLRVVDFVDSLNGWTASVGSSIFKTTDGGNTWIAYSGTPMQLKSISMVDTSYGWCAGDDGFFGRIISTNSGGTNWQLQLENQNRAYNGTSAQAVLWNITVGEKISGPDTALIVRTTNGGNTWQERLLNPGDRLRKVQFIDSLHGWINAFQNFMLKTTDGGATWDKFTTPYAFEAFTFIDTLLGWGGFGDVFYRTTDGGMTWEFLYQLPFPGDSFGVRDLSFIDLLNGWAFGGAFYQGISSEAIYRTTDGGHIWFRESIGLTDDFGDLPDGIMLDRYHGWAVAGDGRVLAYRPTTSVVERTTETPRGYHLRTNYPNPFNPTTTIEYELPEESKVVLRVLDVQGKELLKLVKAQQVRGVYRVVFDAGTVATGTYFYELQANSFHAVKQMVLVK